MKQSLNKKPSYHFEMALLSCSSYRDKMGSYLFLSYLLKPVHPAVLSVAIVAAIVGLEVLASYSSDLWLVNLVGLSGRPVLLALFAVQYVGPLFLVELPCRVLLGPLRLGPLRLFLVQLVVQLVVRRFAQLFVLFVAELVDQLVASIVHQHVAYLLLLRH